MAEDRHGLHSLVERYKTGSNRLTEWLYNTAKENFGPEKARALARHTHGGPLVISCHSLVALAKLIPEACDGFGQTAISRDIGGWITTARNVISCRKECSQRYPYTERDLGHQDFIKTFRSILVELKKAQKLLEGPSEMQNQPQTRATVHERRNSNIFENLERHQTPPSSPPHDSAEDSEAWRDEVRLETRETETIAELIALHEIATKTSVSQPPHISTEDVHPLVAETGSQHRKSDSRNKSDYTVPDADEVISGHQPPDNKQEEIAVGAKFPPSLSAEADAKPMVTTKSGDIEDQTESSTPLAPPTTTLPLAPAFVQFEVPSRATIASRRASSSFRLAVRNIALNLGQRVPQCCADGIPKEPHLFKLKRARHILDQAQAERLAQSKARESIARSTIHNNELRHQALKAELSRAYSLSERIQAPTSERSVLPVVELEQFQQAHESIELQLEVLPDTELTALKQELGLDNSQPTQRAGPISWWHELIAFGLSLCVMS